MKLQQSMGPTFPWQRIVHDNWGIVYYYTLPVKKLAAAVGSYEIKADEPAGTFFWETLYDLDEVKAWLHKYYHLRYRLERYMYHLCAVYGRTGNQRIAQAIGNAGTRHTRVMKIIGALVHVGHMLSH